MFDEKLTIGRFFKICIAEVSPVIIMAIIVSMIVEFIETISAFLAVVVFVVGVFFTCYLTLKWIGYSVNNKKILDWIKR